MKIIRSRAPLRLGLAGGGTDVSPYCDDYGGAVLNATIGMYAYCTIEPLTENKVIFIAADRGETFENEALSQLCYDGFLDLHKGAYNRIVREFNHGKPLPCRITTYSDALAGSGLGSSSTMMVAILTAFVEWLNLPLGEYEIAHLAYEIERKEIGLSGGRQDQYAATFGGFNFMEFNAGDHVIVNPLRVKNWIINELNSSMVLYYTGVSRSSASIIEQQIEQFKIVGSDSLVASHQIKRDAYEMKEALLKGDMPWFANILGRSWEAKRKLAANITNPEIDALMSDAKAVGALAGKVSGAGGGGFIMFIVDPVKKLDLVNRLDTYPGKVVRFHFEKQGVQSWQI
ncbi:MAG: GHMP kinase [Methylovulum sp.]|nr:GHMP kinase [Methylovulum sp.]